MVDEIVVILGPSGAGKRTAIAILEDLFEYSAITRVDPVDAPPLVGSLHHLRGARKWSKVAIHLVFTPTLNDNLESQFERFVENCDFGLRSLQRDYSKNFKVVFLYCSQAQLKNRQQYGFHPLRSFCGSIEAAIFKECEVMTRLFLRLCSSFRDDTIFLDTSSWVGSQMVELKEALRRIHSKHSEIRMPANSELVTLGWNRMEGLMRQMKHEIEGAGDCLVVGESGTGKELIASALSKELGGKEPVVVDCAAIPEDLIESELFGHVKGAFTSAVRDRPGQVKQAEGGTLFIDEIGLINKSFQAKLLRFVEKKQYRRVGSDVWEIPVHCRIIAATSRNLEAAVADGTFLNDLYQRLNKATINVPALRERREDIPLLLERYANGKQFSSGAMTMLFDYHWPGNVRELKYMAERISTGGTEVVVSDLPFQVVSRYSGAIEHESFAKAAQLKSDCTRSDEDIYLDVLSRRVKDRSVDRDVRATEKKVIEAMLEGTGGDVTESARQLKMDRLQLHRLIKRYGLDASKCRQAKRKEGVNRTV